MSYKHIDLRNRTANNCIVVIVREKLLNIQTFISVVDWCLPLCDIAHSIVSIHHFAIIVTAVIVLATMCHIAASGILRRMPLLFAWWWCRVLI